MAKLTDRIAYVRGLAEGMEIDTKNGQGKLFAAVLDALDEIAASVGALEEQTEELNDYVDSIDEDLSALEESLDDDEDDDEDDDDFDDEFDEDDDDEFDEDDDEDEDGCCCGECEGECDCDECGGDVYVECMCPLCHGAFYALETELNGGAEFVCPHCEKQVRANPDYEDEIPIAKPVKTEE